MPPREKHVLASSPPNWLSHQAAAGRLAQVNFLKEFLIQKLRRDHLLADARPQWTDPTLTISSALAPSASPCAAGRITVVLGQNPNYSFHGQKREMRRFSLQRPSACVKLSHLSQVLLTGATT
jgi:hypothetical protein